MSTVKTTICRHVGVEDIPLFEPDLEQVTFTADEAALHRFLRQHQTDTSDYPALVRCAETNEVVAVKVGHNSGDVIEDCRRDHWRLVHQTIETGMEVVHP